MKKQLLGTSALIASVMFMGVGAQAEQAPTLSMSGNAKFEAYAFQNSKGNLNVIAPTSSPKYGNGLGYAFTENGEIDFVVAGVAANGLEYNYTIILNGDSSAAPGISENRIELKGSWGTLQLGDKMGPEDILMTDAANVLGATGGFDGDFSNVFAQTAGVFTGDSMQMDTGTATKAIYYTPRYSGFMLGASFTPLSNHKGNAAINTNGTPQYGGTNANSYNNHGVSSGALNYSHEFSNGFGLSMTAAGMSASTSKNTNNNLTAGNSYSSSQLKTMKAWQLGTLFNYSNWQLGAGYIDNKQSGVVSSPSVTGYNGGKAWSAALGYTFGASKVAAGYQGSEQKNGSLGKGKGDIYSVTADHTLAPGLGVYAEYDYLRLKVPDAALTSISQNQVINGGGSTPKASNKGSVFILGTKISF